ncbi:Gfo/Idh/MocA family protein [Parenemella sanctibonifatiensis]|uniref:Oxidoreductase n=1 Tax=Parenemella sanctibonifatiensis TaxID=2016505 RepID=A0A255E155_9ACTN|nr:Gfo/Idh/MocA family oxidoreductase [Parenemella sanctibonifatiensis]OYN85297.1 oxidoreductase [Parenemella sanctibonifatiensis]
MTDAAEPTQQGEPTRVGLVGANGYGQRHRGQLAPRVAAGAVDLVGIADPYADGQDLEAPWYVDLETMLAEAAPEVVILATPINTHLPMAELALRSGVDVYVEKPPVSSLAEAYQLQQTIEETGRALQVGFQTQGSLGLPAIADLILSGELGELQGISGVGPWLRRRQYWQRAPWAGRRTLNQLRVGDGVSTNPLAHAVRCALGMAGIDRIEQISEVRTELYHANPIETDDLAWINVVAEDGAGAATPPLSLALSLVSPDHGPAWVQTTGSDTVARFFYNEDRLVLLAGDQVLTETRFERTSLLDNLLAHRVGEADLISPLTASLPFMAVLEATQTGPIEAVPEAYMEWRDSGDQAHPVVAGVDDWLLRAALEHRGFAEVGAPWATPAAAGIFRPQG